MCREHAPVDRQPNSVRPWRIPRQAQSKHGLNQTHTQYAADTPMCRWMRFGTVSGGAVIGYCRWARTGRHAITPAVRRA